MNFVAKIKAARDVVEDMQRISVRALGRQLELKGDELEEIIEELVEIQTVARLEGKALVWVGDALFQANARTNSNALDSTAETPKNYTPKHLADKILASRSAMEGEKKQVTVLFCDVVGSMDLAEALGPEAWHQTLNRFFELLTSAIHEFEGTVNQYTGDGIMALFGAPIAAEDHARRACMAALAIQEKLAGLRAKVQTEHGERFAARIGINSGEVVVGKIGDDLRMDYTAQGQVVGIAARLEALAESGAALISAHTEKLAAGYFELQPLGEQTIKGLNRPLPIFRLHAARAGRTRLDIARERGFSPFVGRDSELALLQQALKRARAGRGQVVEFVAPPGVGKSRLCWEFRQACEAQGDLKVITAQAQSQGRMAPYSALFQMLAPYYGFTADDSPAQRRAKLREKHLAWDPRAEAQLPLAYEIIGAPDPDHPPPPMSPEVRQAAVIRGLSWCLRAGSSEPTVYIAEDLHWFDEASLEVLAHWVPGTASANSLLVMNYRPEFRPRWGDAHAHVQRLSLQQLDPEAQTEMLQEALGNAPELEALSRRIADASAGNPFFAEEIVQSLIEAGELVGERGAYRLARPAVALPLPDSVHNVLAARIDRLAEPDKAVLQAAAVLGRGFASTPLAELCGAEPAQVEESLERLRLADLVHPLGPERFQFKHALTQDVAYGSLLQARRQALHQQVADGLRTRIDQDQDPDLWAPLAHHQEQAGALPEAALSLYQAAKASFARDLHESLRLRRDFLRLEAEIGDDPRLLRPGLSARRALLEWSQTERMSAEEAARLYNEACALATRANNPVALATIWGAYAIRLNAEGRHDESCALADRLLAAVAPAPASAGKLAALGIVGGLVYGMAGRTAQARAAADEALAMLEAHPEFETTSGLRVRSVATIWSAMAQGLGGDAQAAIARLDALVAAGDYENDIMIQFADGNVYGISMAAGIDVGAAARNARITRRRDAGIGAWWDVSGLFHTALGHAHQHDWAQAERDFLRCLDICRGNDGVGFMQLFSEISLTQVLLRQHRHDEALAQARHGLTRSKAAGAPWIHAMAAWYASQVHREVLGADALEQRQAILADWDRTIEGGGLHLFRHLWWWESARLAQVKGDPAGHRDGLEQALASAEACGASGHAESIRESLALNP